MSIHAQVNVQVKYKVLKSCLLLPFISDVQGAHHWGTIVIIIHSHAGCWASLKCTVQLPLNTTVLTKPLKCKTYNYVVKRNSSSVQHFQFPPFKIFPFFKNSNIRFIQVSNSKVYNSDLASALHSAEYNDPHELYHCRECTCEGEAVPQREHW